ncbi:sulfatase [Saliphagus infecundisoli]|uniref:Sulfatase n=1 Tax=Saliphagus infecundisoli TaxID=1849069 RepID=A0ABD5QKY8_9EURY|nr:sulfatase [Saliphagus infecundisoli]
MSTNVLFLAVDSLRYDAVFGDNSFDTPNLDTLSNGSVVFHNCFAQGVSTAPSMTSLLTGRYPLEYGGHWYIEETQPTIAEQFQNSGYTTGAIHSNPNVSRLRNFDKGFDYFEENIIPIQSDGLLEAAPDDALRYLNKFVRILSKSPYMPVSKVNRKLTDWIASTADPWFLWTQYMDTHGPYLPGGAFTYRNKFRAEKLWRKAAVNSPDEISDEEHEELLTNYRKEVEYFDVELGKFLQKLKEEGEWEDTLIIVVGDHGDEFYEHGLYGHGNLPYDELTHVPLLVKFPRENSVGATDVNELVRTVDILPTALDYVEADLTDEMKERMRGESLIPLIRDDQSPSYDVVVTEKEMREDDHLRFGFRTDEWKYLYDGKNEREFLYDLVEDPDESTDISDSHEETMDAFREHLEDRLDAIEETSEDIHIPAIDEQAGVEEQLKALGYK